MEQWSRIKIETGAFFTIACVVFILPLWFLVSMLLAGMVHEVFHYIALKLSDVTVYQIRIGSLGASMDTEDMTPIKELICAMAGPLGSLMLVLLFRWIPGIAFCGLIQGCFNMLPIYPMDGGRIVKSLLDMLKIQHIERILLVIEITVGAVIFGLGIWGTFVIKMGLGPLILGAAVVLRIISRKSPCKVSRLGVQ